MLNFLSSSKWHWVWIPITLFVVLLAHGASLGLTDDEAYYWVLAQRPALGYAFHPPVVAWVISIAQGLLGWLVGNNSAGLVRLPAIAFSAGILGLGLYWIQIAGGERDRMGRAALAILSFAGLFAASWMMVPDLPLIFGWMLMFVITWKLCFQVADGDSASGKTRVLYGMLSFGVMLSLLSKYSAVLAAFSVLVSLFLWAPKSVRWKGVGAVIAGGLLAALPILIWNAQHEWASILYQIRDRHGSAGGGASFSGVRYARFWGVQLLLAGPSLLIYSLFLVTRVRPLRLKARDTSANPGSFVSRFVFVWAAPAALVFCLQPAWADFKPHWAFVVWLPIVLELAWAWSRGLHRGWARVQVAYGLSFATLGLVLCHVPAQAWLTSIWTGKEPQPVWDVTNDMYGWRDLSAFLMSPKVAGSSELPVVGSRYQTSSQAAFALGDPARVSLIPRDLKQRDEWPQLQVSEGEGPEWPRLIQPVLFVTDNRYTAGPEFREAQCTKLGRLEKRRWDYLAKWIEVWRCDPLSSI